MTSSAAIAATDVCSVPGVANLPGSTHSNFSETIKKSHKASKLQQQPTSWKQSEYSKHCQILYMSDHSSGHKPLYIGLRNELSYLENSRFYFDMASAVICIHGQLTFLHLSFQYRQSSQAVSCQPLAWETHSKSTKKETSHSLKHGDKCTLLITDWQSNNTGFTSSNNPSLNMATHFQLQFHFFTLLANSLKLELFSNFQGFARDS